MTVIDQPRSQLVIVNLLEQLKFPALARNAKHTKSLEMLNGYASIILHEALRKCDKHILAAYDHWLGGIYA